MALAVGVIRNQNPAWYLSECLHRAVAHCLLPHVIMTKDMLAVIQAEV